MSVEEEKKPGAAKNEQPPIAPLGAMQAGVQVYFAVLAGDTADSFESSDTGGIERILIIFGVMAALGFCFTFSHITIFGWISERSAIRFRLDYFSALLRQDMAYFDTMDTSVVPQVLTQDVEKFRQTFTMMNRLISVFAQLWAGIAMSMYFGWHIGLCILVVIPFTTIGAAGMAFSMMQLDAANNTWYAKAGGVVDEVLHGMRTVAAFGGERHEVERYTSHLDEARRGGVKLARTLGASTGLLNGGSPLGLALTFYVAGTYVLYRMEYPHATEDEMPYYDSGRVIQAFLTMLTGLMACVDLGQPFISSMEGRAVAYRVFKLMDDQPSIENEGTHETPWICKVTETVKFDNVVFRYPNRGAIDVLKGINFSIKQGEKVALVGQSGSGKSTIVSLLEKFYLPTEGKITVNGVDLCGIPAKSWRKMIGYVGQEPVLFSTSLALNISGGDTSIPRTRIEEVAKQAEAFAFISKMPKGFQTEVTNGGSSLSGGQKQRIAIARALLHKPQLLLLDEATSALDLLSESMVQKTLDGLMANSNLMILAIAHRLSTIRNANTIYLLQDGVVAESGTHKELMEKKNHYYNLVKLQEHDDEVDGIADIDPNEAENSTQPMSARRQSNLARRSSVKRASIIDDVMAGGAVFDPNGKSAIRASIARRASALPLVEDKMIEDMRAKAINNNYKLRTPMRRLFAISKPERMYYVIGIITALLAGSTMPFQAYFLADSISKFSICLPCWMFHERAWYSSADFVFGNNTIGENGTMQAYWDNTLTASGMFPDYFVMPSDNCKETCSDVTSTEIAFISLMLTFVGVGAIVFQFICTWVFGYIGEWITMRLRTMSFSAMVRMHIGYHDHPDHTPAGQASQLSKSVTDVACITGRNTGQFAQLLGTLFAGIAIGLVSCWQLALMVLGLFPFFGTVIAYLTSLILRESWNVEKGDGAYFAANQVASDAIVNLRTIRALVHEDISKSVYSKAAYVECNKAQKQCWKKGLGAGFLSASVVLFALAIFGFMDLLLSDESLGLNFTDVFKTVLCISFSIMQAGIFASIIGDVAKTKLAAFDLFQTIDNRTEIDAIEPTGTCKDLGDGSVEFDNVEFTYPHSPNMPVLCGMSFKIKRGQTVALVGPSGGGKSTAVEMMMRFYDPDNGCIKIGGVPLTKMDISYWRQQIGYVGQEPVLFNVSVRENIAYGARDADFRVLEKAAETAMLDLKQTNPNEQSVVWESTTGGRTTQVSGGQKQRIAIARAIARNPRYMFLDEATSALDATVEENVRLALTKGNEGRTTFMVAHRLTAIRNVDTILVLSSGAVVEKGTHEELLKMGGIYSNIANSK